eukprot:IDg22388t1
MSRSALRNSLKPISLVAGTTTPAWTAVTIGRLLVVSSTLPEIVIRAVVPRPSSVGRGTQRDQHRNVPRTVLGEVKVRASEAMALSKQAEQAQRCARWTTSMQPGYRAHLRVRGRARRERRGSGTCRIPRVGEWKKGREVKRLSSGRYSSGQSA